VLRWVKGHEASVVTVLGNHDLHLIARAWGIAEAKQKDTLDDVLGAPDRDELIDWLRTRPLLHRENGRLLVHGGLHPAWTVDEAEALAREVEEVLRSERGPELLRYRKKHPRLQWSDDLTGVARLSVALRTFVTIRVASPEGKVDYSFSDEPARSPHGFKPWYALDGRRSQDVEIVFGHWSALGHYRGHNVTALDSGCVWGRKLTAYRLEDGSVFTEPYAEKGLGPLARLKRLFF
jgi:bis(5'-nucleosyl)-tetraphosphatase (symmetrical)